MKSELENLLFAFRASQVDINDVVEIGKVLVS